VTDSTATRSGTSADAQAESHESPRNSPQSDQGFDVIRRNQLRSFVVLTLVLSWGWWMLASTVLAGGEEFTRVLIAPGAFGPPVAALLVVWASGDDVRVWVRGLFRWRVSPRFYLAASSIPIAIALGGTAIFLAGGIEVAPGLLADRAVLFPIVLVFTALLGGGQEEPGWRGFALPRLQSEYDALTASIVIGVVWAVWHLPLFLLEAPRNATGSFGTYLVTVLAISVVLTHLYNASRGSVLLAALAHGGVNAAGVLFPVTDGVGSEAALVADLAMTVPLVLTAAAVIARYGPAALAPGERTTIPSSAAPANRSGN